VAGRHGAGEEAAKGAIAIAKGCSGRRRPGSTDPLMGQSYTPAGAWSDLITSRS